MRLTLSRTSWAATSPSFSSVNWMKTCEMPSDDDDRNSSMPLIVLTASSILSVICRLDLLGRRAGLPRGHRDHREIDLRETVEPELQIAEDAEDHQHQNQHRGEDRTLDADGGESIHGRARLSVMDRFGLGRPAISLPVRPARISTFGPFLLAQGDDLFAGHAVADDEHPAHLAGPQHGAGRHEAAVAWPCNSNSAVANSPGRSRWSGFGATASTTIERVSLVTTGAMNRTRASNVRSGKLSTWKRTVWPGWIRPMSCCGTVSDSRNGSIRTSVTTLVACMPGDDLLRRRPPASRPPSRSNGARIVVSSTAFFRMRQLDLRPSGRPEYAWWIWNNAWR